jgi:valyl-tRNA synthetase
MDTLIRLHRMRGQRTKWILGTDHAGIATQTQVERALLDEGTSREAIGREAFEKRVWRWREEYGGQIIEQLKRFGASCDYDDERFTLDEEYVDAVLRVFVSLYGKGYIYRDRYLVNWDPGSRSAISDLEVEDREVTDTLYYVDYPLASGGRSVTVATVRPETMLADVAVAVHPDDERYRELIGQRAILPLVGRELPVIADEYVKPDFGTGALKITPGHDPNDFEIGRRHGLGQVSVIGEDGRITDEAPERFVGMTVAEAQRAVVAELDEQGLISKTEPYVRPYGAVLAAVGPADRAARFAPVVHAHGRARQARHGRGPGGASPIPPSWKHARVHGLDGEHPPVGDLPSAVVGPPPAGVVSPR